MSQKMTPELEQRIKEKAYEIWEFRQQNGMIYVLDGLHHIREINDKDDYYEAMEEILNGGEG